MEMENVNNNINNNNNNNMSKVVVSENNPYDMNSQFKQWLNSQKSIWKSLKINKKQITRKGDLR